MAKKSIVIDNFLKMIPEVPEYSQRNTNYLLSGVDPIYYLENSVQEQQSAPLAAARDWTELSASIEGNIVQIIPSIGGTYDAFFITDTTQVYGIIADVPFSLGYPSGSSQNTASGTLCIGANSLFATYSTTSLVYYISLSGGGWNNFGSISPSSSVHPMQQFSDHIAIADSSGSNTTTDLVRLIDPTSGTPTILSTPFLDLGLGFTAFKIENYNDKYLAIAVGKQANSSIFTGYPQNYIYLWDGSAPAFNYSMIVPGKFIDMKVVNSILQVAVEVAGGKTSIFYLKNTALARSFTTQYLPISTGVHSLTPCSLFDYKNYLGVKLFDVNDVTTPLLINGSDEMGDIEFIRTVGRNFDQIAVGYAGGLYASKYVPSGNSVLCILPETGNYQNIGYESQWIPVQNLDYIDIYYEEPPQGDSDQINVTIYGVGEDIITGSSTTPLTSITNTNFLNEKRTRLDCGNFTGDHIKIALTTVNTTWQPIIRQIVLTYA